MKNKKLMAKKKETLCSNNMSVKYELTKLRARLKKLGVTDEEVYNKIDESRETLKVMKLQGQHMENRLHKYIDAISALGFRRIKNNKERRLNG